MLELEKVCLTCFQQPPSRYWLVQGAESSPVADVLKKHFWFTEDLHQAIICQCCWDQVNSFHQFYASVEELYRHRLVSLVVKCEPEVGDNYFLGDSLMEMPDYQLQESYTIAKEADNTMELLVELDDPVIESYAPGHVKVSHAFKCDQCPQTFIRQSVYRRHKRDHKSDIKCEHCGQIFKAQSTLDRHIKRKHDGQPQLICDVCNQQFQFLSLLLLHKRQNKHAHEQLVQCKKCSRWFLDRSSQLDHMERKHHGTDVRCDKCDYVAPNQLALGSHKRRRHDDPNVGNNSDDKLGIKSASPESPAVAKVETSLKKPAKEVEGKDEPQQVQASDIDELHSTPCENDFKCERCGKSYLKQETLDKHLKKKNCVGSSSGFDCEVCLRSYKQLTTLLQHKLQMKHAHKKIMRCNKCRARWFPDRTSWLDHMQRKHNVVEVGCDICDHVAPNQLALCAHKRRKHGVLTAEDSMDQQRGVQSSKEVEGDNEPQQVQSSDMNVSDSIKHILFCTCEHCGKRYYGEERLNRHINGMKCAGSSSPFVCDVCSKKFTSLPHLLQHKMQAKHSHEQIKRCKKCRRWLADNDSWRDHMQREHSQKEADQLAPTSQKLPKQDELREENDMDKTLPDHNRVVEDASPKSALDVATEESSKKGYDANIDDSHSTTKRKYVKSYICSRCPQSFHRKTPYNKHMMAHFHGIKCELCGKTCANKAGLAVHMKRKHDSGRSKLTCNVCHKKFVFLSLLLLHKRQKKHSHEQITQCKTCHQWLPNRASWRDHMQQRHHGTEAVCDICDHVASNQHALDAHKRRKHDDQTVENSCMEQTLLDVSNQSVDVGGVAPECPPKQEGTSSDTAKEVDDNANESYHVQSFDANVSDSTKRRKNYRCSKCPQIFFHKTSLLRHMLEHRIDLKCEHCGKIFKLQGKLDTHIKRKHGVSPKLDPNDCTGTTLLDMSNVQPELESSGLAKDGENTTEQPGKVEGENDSGDVHSSDTKESDVTKDGKFQCSMCPQSFFHKSVYKMHKKGHRSDIKCEQCGEIFKLEAKLAMHIKLKHAAVSSECICDVCSKKFKCISLLLKHKWQRKHSHEQIMRCKKCSRWLPDRARWRDHMQRKHNGTEVTCDICGHVAPHQHALDAHKRRKHDEEYDAGETSQLGLSDDKMDVTGDPQDVTTEPQDCSAGKLDNTTESHECSAVKEDDISESQGCSFAKVDDISESQELPSVKQDDINKPEECSILKMNDINESQECLPDTKSQNDTSGTQECSIVTVTDISESNECSAVKEHIINESLECSIAKEDDISVPKDCSIVKVDDMSQPQECSVVNMDEICESQDDTTDPHECSVVKEHDISELQDDTSEPLEYSVVEVADTSESFVKQSNINEPQECSVVKEHDMSESQDDTSKPQESSVVKVADVNEPHECSVVKEDDISESRESSFEEEAKISEQQECSFVKQGNISKPHNYSVVKVVDISDSLVNVDDISEQQEYSVVNLDDISESQGCSFAKQGDINEPQECSVVKEDDKSESQDDTSEPQEISVVKVADINKPHECSAVKADDTSESQDYTSELQESSVVKVADINKPHECSGVKEDDISESQVADINKPHECSRVKEDDTSNPQECSVVKVADINKPHECSGVKEDDKSESRECSFEKETDISEPLESSVVAVADTNKSHEYSVVKANETAESQECSLVKGDDISEPDEYSVLHEDDISESQECSFAKQDDKSESQADTSELHDFSVVKEVDISEPLECSIVKQGDISEQDYSVVNVADISESQECSFATQSDISEPQECSVAKDDTISEPLDDTSSFVKKDPSIAKHAKEVDCAEQSSSMEKINVTKGKRKFECQQCPQGFNQKSLYKKHIREHVGSCTCEHCGQIFKVRTDLEDHIKRNHGKLTVLSCEVCCKNFSCLASLLRHKWEYEHAHELIMRCKICSKWLTDRASWSDHMQKRHSGAEGTCAICGHVARHQHALAAHMRRKHEQQDPVEGEKETRDVQKSDVTANKPKFECVQCPEQSFSCEIIYRRHLEEHLGIF